MTILLLNLSKLPYTMEGKQYAIIHVHVPNSLLNVTMCKDIQLVIRYINSHLNYIPVEPSNVPVKSLNVGNEEIFFEVKVLREYTTTVAMKEDIQRDMDHLYVSLDQYTDEDILQQITTALNLVEVNIIEVLTGYKMNQQTKHYLHKNPSLNFKHCKIPSTKITKSTNKNIS